MKKLAAAALVLCGSCAPVARLQGAAGPERWRLAPAGYYEDEPQARTITWGIVLTCGVIAGFVAIWPEIEDLFVENLSTWFYGY